MGMSVHNAGPFASKPDPAQGAAGSATRPRFRSPPPPSAGEPSELDGQRQRTLGFVNEGLEVRWGGANGTVMARLRPLPTFSQRPSYPCSGILAWDVAWV